MKTKLFCLITLVVVSITSCDNKKLNETEIALASADSLARKAINERDSLIILFNEISQDIIKLRELESIVVVPGNMQNESYSVPTIQDDIKAIQQSLQERKEKIKKLENQLAKQSLGNKEMQKMIDNLKSQILQNEQVITDLKQQLSNANLTIANLNTQVDSLNTSVSNVTAEKNSALAKNEALTEDLNRCYYVLGSGKELKDHKIIETGFLRKTKILQGDFDQSYFTSADKRVLTNIPLYSKKAKVYTNQPKDSYSITEDANGLKTLNITNPERFWSVSNFLVVQTD